MSQSAVELTKKQKLITQALTLQRTLIDLSSKTEMIRKDNQRLNDEKQIVLAYLNSKK
jgi:hypothetical protein